MTNIGADSLVERLKTCQIGVVDDWCDIYRKQLAFRKRHEVSALALLDKLQLSHSLRLYLYGGSDRSRPIPSRKKGSKGEELRDSLAKFLQTDPSLRWDGRAATHVERADECWMEKMGQFWAAGISEIFVEEKRIFVALQRPVLDVREALLAVDPDIFTENFFPVIDSSVFEPAMGIISSV